MAFEKIYTFTNDGYDWDLYADFTNQLVQTVNTPSPQVTGPTVDAGILGLNVGDPIANRCDGTTFLQVTALFTYPYCQFEAPVLNSPLCGYTPPTCDVQFTVSTTNATNGMNTGTATVNMISSGTFVFSIDRVAWQTSPLFTNLFPGNYTIYVSQAGLSAGRTRCRANGQFAIQNDVVDLPVNNTPIPYQDTKNLCFKFRLTYNGSTYEVREPLRWDTVEITGERDLEYHGYQYKYTDGEVLLGFDCDAGGDLIANVYGMEGQDGEIIFEHYYTYFGAETILFRGRLMLNKYKKYTDRVECVVENEQFDATLLSRLEVPVSMTATKTYDGSDVVPPPAFDLTLHPKEILSQFIANSTEAKQGGISGAMHSTFFSILPGIDNPSINDLLESSTFKLYPSIGLPESDSLFIHKFSKAGKLNLNLSWPLNFTVNVDNNDVRTGSFDCYMFWRYRAYDALTGTYTETGEVISSVVATSVGAFSALNYEISLLGTKTLTDFDVKAGDEIYFYVFIESNREFDGVSFPFITQPTMTYSAKLSEITAASTANTWILDDSIRHIINVIGDNKYVFRSSFFERASAIQVADGQAAKRMLTNGFQIRKFNVNEKPLKVDFKTVLSSLNAQNCIGMVYSTDAYGRSVVRIERRDFFYQDNEILAIYETEDYNEEVATDFVLFNELEFGYKTYKTDGFNSLDEFNTEQKNLSPIKKNPKKLSQVSDIIASGFTIEDIRRQQFAEKPTESYENDESPVMICVKREGVAGWVTEKDESFDLVDNLFSPGTSYNLRLSPRRMLYNWFIWLKGCFFYKDGGALIKNTKFVQNGDMETQFNAAETDVIGDINKDLIVEKEDFEVSRMNDTYSIYRPEWVNIVCRLSPTDVQLINEALTGVSDRTKNYGYIMVKTPEEVWQAGWVFNLKYNYATERATIKMLKKAVSPESPQTAGSCCPWLVVNGCYLLVNGNKLIA